MKEPYVQDVSNSCSKGADKASEIDPQKMVHGIGLSFVGSNKQHCILK